MSLIFSYLKQHYKVLFAALGLAIINQVFSLLDPQIFQYLVDNYATKIDELTQTEFLHGVLLLLLAAVGVAFVSRVAKAFQDYYVNVTTQRVGTDLYGDSIRHAFSLPFGVFEDQRSGELLNRIQKMRTDSQTLISLLINVVFLSLVGIIFVIGYATYVHPLIGLTYFLIIPSLGSVTFVLSKKIKEAQARIVKETAALAGQTTETIRNVELVKSLGLEDREIQRLNDVNEEILRLELQKVKYVRSLDFVQGTLINLLRAVIQLLMFYLIFKGEITLGQFFTLFFYSFAIFQPLYQLGQVANAYQEAKASSEELQKILLLPSEDKPLNPEQLSSIETINYNKVSFSYEGTNRVTLQNISFTIKAGGTVAFVGPSGSGKSTIIKLLAGLYRPTSGEILLNGKDSRTIDYTQMRNKLGLVSQETQLFAGTIRDNLLFVKPSATDEECREALTLASVHSILERAGEGLDTKIGEGGIKMSGGERQRLAIARALLRDPDILIFDEATSSLDSLTEHAITETIQSIAQQRPHMITILIAHRISTVIHADRIYVLEKGKIIEQGSHNELLKNTEGLYEALWKQQTSSA